MKSKTRIYLTAFWAICLFLGAGFASLHAQTALLGSTASQGWNWKSQPQIDQILQQELTETDAALSQPDLTDWASASFSAYRSLLVFTQEELQGKQDVLAALQSAFERMKTEPVSNATARSWVIDDMDAKKNELIVRLSEN